MIAKCSEKFRNNMIFKKNKKNQYKAIEKVLTIIQQKLLWLKANKQVGSILLAGNNNNFIESISEILFQKLTEDHSKSFLLLNINDNSLDPEKIDWEHDLVIAYCNNLNSCPGIFKFSNYIDSSILMIEAGNTSRTSVREMVTNLNGIKIPITGSILHNFQEKIPQILRRIIG